MVEKVYNPPKFLTHLRRLDACLDSRDWILDNKIRTLREAWKKCPRGEWMEWLQDQVLENLGRVQESTMGEESRWLEDSYRKCGEVCSRNHVYETYSRGKFDPFCVECQSKLADEFRKDWECPTMAELEKAADTYCKHADSYEGDIY